MMTKSRARHEASLLVPLLKSIAPEVEERWLSLRRLDLRLRTAAYDEARTRNLEADRANHRKELRLTVSELERMGCAVDNDHPLRVRIPGPKGTLESGYVWDALRADELQSALAPADSAA